MNIRAGYQKHSGARSETERPYKERGVEMMLREKVRKAWERMDVWELVREMMEKAVILCDLRGRPQGSMDSVVVYDIGNDEICVIQEGRNQYTKGFIYLYRMHPEDKPEDEDELYFSLMEYIPQSIDSIGVYGSWAEN